MGNGLKVRESKRDEDLGLIKKSITISNIPLFETPTKSIKHFKKDNFLDSNMLVNEIVQIIDEDTVGRMEKNGLAEFTKNVKKKYKKDKLNLVVPFFRFDKIPDKPALRTLASFLYSSSDSIITLPSVKFSLLKEDDRFSDKRIESYINMVSYLLEGMHNVGNKKIIMGNIPLVPIHFARPIINFCHENELSAFSIDAGTKDIIGNEGDFGSILLEINTQSKLNESLIYACNIGCPQFEKFESRADDFLSMFACVDILGGTFKSRAIDTDKPVIPRAKIFSRNEYNYKIFYPKSKEASDLLKTNNLKDAYLSTLKNFNQTEQLKETQQIKSSIGESKISKYLETKKAINKLIFSKLEAIARILR